MQYVHCLLHYLTDIQCVRYAVKRVFTATLLKTSMFTATGRFYVICLFDKLVDSRNLLHGFITLSDVKNRNYKLKKILFFTCSSGMVSFLRDARRK